jgi:WD40 repeat protein
VEVGVAGRRESWLVPILTAVVVVAGNAAALGINLISNDNAAAWQDSIRTHPLWWSIGFTAVAIVAGAAVWYLQQRARWGSRGRTTRELVSKALHSAVKQSRRPNSTNDTAEWRRVVVALIDALGDEEGAWLLLASQPELDQRREIRLRERADQALERAGYDLEQLDQVLDLGRLLRVLPNLLREELIQAGELQGTLSEQALVQLLADVGEGTRRQYARPSLAPAYQATVREIRHRTTVLRERRRELADIASFATGREGYRWLVGEAYAGKTALLAEAVTSGLPSQVDTVCFFLSRLETDADSNRFLAAMVPQLAGVLNEDAPDPDPHQFRALWLRASRATAARARHLLLVVDGLDEDLRPTGLRSVAAMLPATIEPNAHVLVSSRPYPELLDDVAIGHPLGRAPRVSLEPFEGATQLASLAKQELTELVRGDDAGFAADVLGVLAAAAGPLAMEDLAHLTCDTAIPPPEHTRRVRRLVTERAGRSLLPVGPPSSERLQFAHASLLEYAQSDPNLSHPEYRQHIHEWAQRWRASGWPSALESDSSTPRYLLDAYPSTLNGDPQRLAELVGDVGWVNAAIQAVGVGRTMSVLRTANAAVPKDPRVAGLLAAVRCQSEHLAADAVHDCGFVLRQLSLQAMEFSDESLAVTARDRLVGLGNPCPVPQWTTRRTSRALAAELGSHDGMVWAVAVLPNGCVVSGGDDGTLRVWDPTALVGSRGRYRVPGERVDDGVMAPFILSRGHESLRALAVLPDGRVVAGGRSGLVQILNPSLDARPLVLGRHDGQVWVVATLPDGRVVTGGSDGWIRVWDPAHRAARVEVGCNLESVWAVAVLPDGRIVASGYRGRVWIWDPTSGADPVELIRRPRPGSAVSPPDDSPTTVEHSEGAVTREHSRRWPVTIGTGRDNSMWALVVLPNGRVVSGGGDGSVQMWEAILGTATVDLGRHNGPVRAAAVLPDARVVTGGHDGRIRIWDPAIADGSEPAPIEVGRHNGPVPAVAVLPDGRVVTGGHDGRVRIWDPITAHNGAVAPVGQDRLIGRVWASAVLPDGRVVAGGDDGWVRVWDPTTAGRDEPASVELGRHSASVRAVAVLPDGDVVIGGDDGWVRVWDSAGRLAPIDLGHHDGPVSSVAVLPDGRVITGGRDGRVRIWDLTAVDRRLPNEVSWHAGPVRTVAARPDGRVVVSGYLGWVQVLDPTGRFAPVQLAHRPSLSVALRPDGHVYTYGHDNLVSSVAVLPDGRVVTGAYDGRVRVWEPIPRTEAVDLGRHEGPVRTVVALADGRVVTGGYDGRVRLWDVNTRTATGLIAYSANALATGVASTGDLILVLTHENEGLSAWTIQRASAELNTRRVPG